MSIKYNGVDVSKINYNNTALTKVNYNNVAVFELLLDAPQNLSINENILKFDDVENSTNFDIYANDVLLGNVTK